MYSNLLKESHVKIQNLGLAYNSTSKFQTQGLNKINSTTSESNPDLLEACCSCAQLPAFINRSVPPSQSIQLFKHTNFAVSNSKITFLRGSPCSSRLNRLLKRRIWILNPNSVLVVKILKDYQLIMRLCRMKILMAWT